MTDPLAIARATQIEIAAACLAAGLAEARDLSLHHALNADDVELAASLAAVEPGNPYAIPAGATGEPLALWVDLGAMLLGANFTTPERYHEKCLAGREDAGDILDVVQKLAHAQYGAPRRAQSSPPPAPPAPAAPLVVPDPAPPPAPAPRFIQPRLY